MKKLFVLSAALLLVYGLIYSNGNRTSSINDEKLYITEVYTIDGLNYSGGPNIQVQQLINLESGGGSGSFASIGDGGTLSISSFTGGPNILSPGGNKSISHPIEIFKGGPSVTIQIHYPADGGLIAVGGPSMINECDFVPIGIGGSGGLAFETQFVGGPNILVV